jgi:hypothetical protein
MSISFSVPLVIQLAATNNLNKTKSFGSSVKASAPGSICPLYCDKSLLVDTNKRLLIEGAYGVKLGAIHNVLLDNNIVKLHLSLGI